MGDTRSAAGQTGRTTDVVSKVLPPATVGIVSPVPYLRCTSDQSNGIAASPSGNGRRNFIFFALEGSIMAQGLLLGLGIPLRLGYLICTLLIIPRLCSLCCTTEKNCKTMCHESPTFLGLPAGASR
jgi:hypothetical protein